MDARPLVTEGAASPVTDRQAEYRGLMRKWWFAAAVGAPTMVLSYPWLIPGLRDVFTKGSSQLWWLWAAMGVASLAVLAYSGSRSSGSSTSCRATSPRSCSSCR